MRHIGEQKHRQDKHKNRPDHPVLHQRESKYFCVPKHFTQLLILYLCQGWIHHDNEACRYQDIGGA